MIDVIDIRILKFIYRSENEITYLSEICALTKRKDKFVRRRLEKLCEMSLIKQTKVYPIYYVANPKLAEKINEITIPVLNIE